MLGIKLLKEENYKFLFTDLDEFLAILQILLDFLSLDDLNEVLTHFDKKKLLNQPGKQTRYPYY